MDRIKLIILGDVSIGKTSLVQQKSNNIFNNTYTSTIGVDFFTFNYLCQTTKKQYKVNIWDTGGNAGFRTIVKTYLKGTHGVIFAFDITCRKSFDNLKYWFDTMNTYDAGKNYLIVGLKSDMEKYRQVSAQDVRQTYNHKYIECSAKDNVNVDKVFGTLIENCLEKENYNADNSFNIEEINTKKAMCCVIS